MGMKMMQLHTTSAAMVMRLRVPSTESTRPLRAEVRTTLLVGPGSAPGSASFGVSDIIVPTVSGPHNFT